MITFVSEYTHVVLQEDTTAQQLLSAAEVEFRTIRREEVCQANNWVLWVGPEVVCSRSLFDHCYTEVLDRKPEKALAQIASRLLAYR